MGVSGDIVVGLDVGTTKICAVVGEITKDGIEIVGVGVHPSVGLRKGVVVNIENTVSSIRQAVEQAEMMSGVDISSVITGIAGDHIEGFNSSGMQPIKGKEVTKKDMEQVLESAKAVPKTTDRRILHTLAQEYILDGHRGIEDPVGMSGVRLEAKVHIVTGAVGSVHNLIKCCNRAGLDVNNIVLQSLASAKAVLTPEESSLGVALVDFGGGTTDIATFLNDSIRHTSGIPIGGNNLTADLSMGLRTPMTAAETLKKNHGCCLTSMVGKDEMVTVAGVGGRKSSSVRRQMLAEILEPRMEELLSLAYDEVLKSGLAEQVAGGLVLTGGSSLLPGIVEMSEQIFNMPTRIGYPRGVIGLSDVVNNPMFATAVGLVLYGAGSKTHTPFSGSKESIITRVFNSMRRWFGAFAG